MTDIIDPTKTLFALIEQRRGSRGRPSTTSLDAQPAAAHSMGEVPSSISTS
jgi:hypothetical protein